MVTYTIEIRTGDRPDTGDYPDAIFRREGITGDGEVIRFTLTTGDVGTGDHTWHVRAVDGAGNSGDFSEASVFTIDPAAALPDLDATLLTPTDGSSGDDTTPTFTWGSMTGDLSPATYTLEIRTGDRPASGDFPDPIFRKEGISGDGSVIRFTLGSGDAVDIGDHTWHVLALDGPGNTGGSGSFTFEVVSDTTSPTVPVLLRPAPAM